MGVNLFSEGVVTNIYWKSVQNIIVEHDSFTKEIHTHYLHFDTK